MATRILWRIALGLAVGLVAVLVSRWVGTSAVWIALVALLVLAYLRARQRA